MPSLPDELFALLENKTLQAREAAEKAARNILAYLKVESSTWWGKKEDPQRDLWLGLRARARQLGYSVEENGEKDPVKRGLPQLVEEIAYEQWHRMLFARFLAENGLLMHPSGVAVSLAECEELAPEEGEDDAWRLAARYAGAMLPGIFKQEDPCAQVRLTPSDHHALESILLGIPTLVFTCDDALGWMYQFWQSKKKKEVNDSERKIGGADISPVTQLFTEDYMVRFLLENSLGAWWAARHPNSQLVKEWEYLRCKDDGTPAAGSFPGWPERAAEVTVMDPCCGSGHFLVAAFDMLRRMRMEEERLDAAEAVRRTLQDNIFGLEIDQRCTQIAWFALSLVGWKSGGFQPLPELNIACTGIPVKGQLNDWLTLAGDDSRVKAGLERLYNLFKDAPDLGSLINPTVVPLADRMFVADYGQVAPVFERAIAADEKKKEDNNTLLGYTANNLLKAVKYLSADYTLVTTNVPYLGRGNQSDFLKNFFELFYDDAKADLATVFIKRCLEFCRSNSSIALVVPQNWTTLNNYRSFRQHMLKQNHWHFALWLGAGAFRTISGEVVKPLLFSLSKKPLLNTNDIFCIDLCEVKSFVVKVNKVKTSCYNWVKQEHELSHPDSRILPSAQTQRTFLSKYASSYQGIKTGDDFRFKRCFWELAKFDDWQFIQSSPTTSEYFSGLTYVLDWRRKGKDMARLQGMSSWNKPGIAIASVGRIAADVYLQVPFTSDISVISPTTTDSFLPIWAYVNTVEYAKLVSELDKKVAITNATLVKVPFDIEYWKEVAAQNESIPEPKSNNPIQWLFLGRINESRDPLHVACARLLGYSWPRQKSDNLKVLCDEDGIACLPAINGEAQAAERLRTLLAAAYAGEWSSAKQEELLTRVSYSGKDLADWLRDGFFEQHCKLFQNRPFIWHIWDGRKDGFSALVNYHKLDRANLEKLTYTYLGAWITDRRKDVEKGIAGAEGRLLAAQSLQDKLKLILAGEPPYDIYVRWKPLHEQPIGWEPDLNDGVRLNIRPFITSGVLRSKFTINWNKDRGTNPDGSERLNDLHLTVAEKRAAREKKLR